VEGHHAPNAKTSKRIGRPPKPITNADDFARAVTALDAPFASHRGSVPGLAGGLILTKVQTNQPALAQSVGKFLPPAQAESAAELGSHGQNAVES